MRETQKQTVTEPTPGAGAAGGPHSYPEALQAVLERVPCGVIETVLLHQALGRAVAEAVFAEVDVPPVRVCAMDGYALPDDGSRTGGYLLLGPGDDDSGCGADRCRRVLTGQPAPGWAQCVAAEEHCRIEGTTITPLAHWPAGKNIRPAGEDARTGELLATPGSLIDPPVLARVASAGRHRIKVIRRPRVRILTTGNELVRPPMRPGSAGQRFECDAIMLAGLLAQAGCRVDPLPHLPDRPEDVRTALHHLPPFDLLITIGGASNSEADLMRPILKDLGASFLFERVQMKPGRPTAFGTWHGRPIFCLPGNPFAAFVAALAFVLPAVRLLAGRHPTPGPTWQARFPTEIPLDPHRQVFLPVRLSRDAGPHPTGTPLLAYGSGMVRSLTEADALVSIPPGTRIPAGSLFPLFWIRSHPGS